MVCVRVRAYEQDFIPDLEFWEGATPNFGVDVEGVYNS